ncbi:MAG TPA: hypothetical protein PK280_13460 [Planctomycetota bacterium]|nr:hypothetical protein [Planctomycetota bacterium]
MPEVEPSERTWRIKRTQSRRWIVERVVRSILGGEVREMSAVYPNREQAEQAITRAMRQESQRWRPS